MNDKQLERAIRKNRRRRITRVEWREIQLQIGTKPDGKPGKATARAVYRWQKLWGFQHKDGILGRMTLLTLGRGRGAFKTASVRPHTQTSWVGMDLAIDVSVYQGVIDFARVAEVLPGPVFVRALDGRLRPDKMWERNCKGFHTGVAYCPVRISSYKPKRFVNAILDAAPGWGVAVDCEYKAVRKAHDHDPDYDAEWLLQATDQLVGRVPEVYVYTSLRTMKLLGEDCMRELDPRVKLWVVDYSLPREIAEGPKRLDGVDWDVWQFCNIGHIYGIRGAVDLNLVHR